MNFFDCSTNSFLLTISSPVIEGPETVLPENEFLIFKREDPAASAPVQNLLDSMTQDFRAP